MLDFIPKLYQIFNYQEVNHPPIHNHEKQEEFISHCDKMLKNGKPNWIEEDVKLGIKGFIKELSSKHFSSEGQKKSFRDIVERVLCNGFQGSA